MKSFKFFFSALTVVFGILKITNILSSDIAMPLMFVCLAITMFITSKEYKENEERNNALYFLGLGIFILLVTAFNVASMIFGF